MTLPYMRVANVQDGHLVLDEVKTITVSREEGRRYLLRSGDVLLTEGGDPDKLGRGCVWREEIAGCIHQNHIFRVRPAAVLSPDYLSALWAASGSSTFRAAKQTTGIATINLTQLKSFRAGAALWWRKNGTYVHWPLGAPSTSQDSRELVARSCSLQSLAAFGAMALLVQARPSRGRVRHDHSL